MNTSNSSSSDALPPPSLTQILVYYVGTPINLLLGFIGNCISLAALYREGMRARDKASQHQKRSNNVYMFQFLIVLTDLFSGFAVAMYLIGSQIFLIQGQTATLAIRQNFPLRWFAAHLLSQIPNMFVTASLLLLAATSADRLYALYRPLRYTKHSHSSKAFGSLLVCVSVGILTSIFDCSRRDVIYSPDDSSYMVVISIDFLNSLVGTALAQSRNAVQILAVAVNILLTVLIIRKYRREMKNRIEKFGEHIRESAETQIDHKTLTTLLLCQDFLVLIGTSPLILLFLILYTTPTSLVLITWLQFLTNIGVQVQTQWNFLIYIAMSKRFRNSVKAVLKCGINSVDAVTELGGSTTFIKKETTPV